MKRLNFTMLFLLAVGLILLFAAGPASAGDKYDDEMEEVICKANLDEDAEVPAPHPVFGTTGKARVKFSFDDDDDDDKNKDKDRNKFTEDRGEATYRLRVNDGLRIFQAHIHCAPAGQTGPIIVWLAGAPPPPTGWDIDGKWIGKTTLDDEDVIPNEGTGDCPNVIHDLRDLADACLEGNCYVNVHSRDNPAGQIRGQLMCKEDDY